MIWRLRNCTNFLHYALSNNSDTKVAKLLGTKEFGYFLNYVLLIIHFPDFPPSRINTPFSRNWSVIFLT